MVVRYSSEGEVGQIATLIDLDNMLFNKIQTSSFLIHSRAVIDIIMPIYYSFASLNTQDKISRLS